MVCAAITKISVADSLPNSVAPMPVDSTAEMMQRTASIVRAGAKLTPRAWKDGARVAVCLTFDVDNEFHGAIANSMPSALSTGEYGATTGLPRLLAILDRQRTPATFFMPAGSAILHPEMIPAIMKSGLHEIGVHGWTHEYIPALADAAQEHDLLDRAMNYLEKAMGKRPVGYRAPDAEFGRHTLEQIREAGFLYDSSMFAMDQPYELLSNGAHTGVIELPASWVADDFIYFGFATARGSLPDPEAVSRIFRSEFDAAYAERTLFVLGMHPDIIGERSRAGELDKLITYMKSKSGVWFATGEQIARYIKSKESH